MIDEIDIAKLKQLYETRFKVQLDDETARRKLVLLVKQIEAVYQPIRRSDALYVNGDVNHNEASKTQ